MARRSSDVNKEEKFFYAAAFFLRPRSESRPEEVNLSVSLERLTSPLKAIKSLNKCHGLCRLEVGAIRELARLGRSIDVLHDPVADNYAHSSVTGLPKASDDDYEKEEYAEALQSVSCWVEVST